MPYNYDDLEMPEDLEDIEILPMGDHGGHEQFQQHPDHQIEESGPLVLEPGQSHAPSSQHQAYPIEESGPMIPEGFRQIQPMPQNHVPSVQPSGPLVPHPAMDQPQFPIQHYHQLHHHHHQNPPMLPREMPGPSQNAQNFPPYPFHSFQPFHHHHDFAYGHHQLRHQIFMEVKVDFDRKAKEFDRKTKEFDRKAKEFDRKTQEFDRRDKEKDQKFKKKLDEKDNQIRERDSRIDQLERQLAQRGTSAHTSFPSPETPRDLHDMPDTSSAQPLHYDSEDEIPEQGFLYQREAEWFLQRTFGGRPWRLKIQDDTAYLFNPIFFRHIKQEKRKVSGAAYIYRSSMRGAYPHVLWKDLQEDEKNVWNEVHRYLSVRQQREIEKGLIKIKEMPTRIKAEPRDEGYERAANGTGQHWQAQQVPIPQHQGYTPGPPYPGYPHPGMPMPTMPPPHPMWHQPQPENQLNTGPQNGWIGGPMMHFQMPQEAMHGQMPMEMQHRMPAEPMQAAPVPRKHVQIKEEIIDEDD
ncbi:Protein CBG26181 [Caenorhabditis briggsae]|uniref:Uncharacterized protein n=2 Tax=Caenorhabditis briggsae TaxID=6238 RepID=A0AAE9DNM5_CAEBR|nr:Protein CBG26181 [Caenorhabditis briggsae]ULU08096.1 hypothetical protein L3Y34_019285 [Caenorhabditis briggsae]CAS00856.1 Protein CBG26181 [Caenorhabditis briggsae]